MSRRVPCRDLPPEYHRADRPGAASRRWAISERLRRGQSAIRQRVPTVECTGRAAGGQTYRTPRCWSVDSPPSHAEGSDRASPAGRPTGKHRSPAGRRAARQRGALRSYHYQYDVLYTARRAPASWRLRNCGGRVGLR